MKVKSLYENETFIILDSYETEKAEWTSLKRNIITINVVEVFNKITGKISIKTLNNDKNGNKFIKINTHPNCREVKKFILPNDFDKNEVKDIEIKLKINW